VIDMALVVADRESAEQLCDLPSPPGAGEGARDLGGYIRRGSIRRDGDDVWANPPTPER
jgi:hypothetical protein